MKYRNRRSNAGFSLIEMIVVLAVMGTLMGIAALNLKPFADPLHDAVARLEGFAKQARSKAMANTLAYRIFVTDGRVYAKYAYRCSDAHWTIDPKLDMKLPSGVSVRPTPPGRNWVCFNSRGYTSRSRAWKLQDTRGRSKKVTVFMGGAVKVQ